MISGTFLTQRKLHFFVVLNLISHHVLWSNGTLLRSPYCRRSLLSRVQCDPTSHYLVRHLPYTGPSLSLHYRDHFSVITKCLLNALDLLSWTTMFLVADTQLYKRLCPSVRPSVGRSVGPWTRVENAYFRPCPPVRNWYWPCIRPCWIPSGFRSAPAKPSATGLPCIRLFNLIVKFRII